MSWFTRQRQDFIRAQLETFGQIRRSDITNGFEVTLAVASTDIATFIEAHPGAIDYDRNAKCYTFDKARLSPPPALPADVVELVIAARTVAFEDQSAEAIHALDKASEAFAERVPWENDPNEEMTNGG